MAKIKPTKKQLIIVCAALLVLAAAAGTWWWQNRAATPEPTPTNQQQDEEYDPEQELRDAEAKLNSADSDEEKAEAYRELANIYANREGEQAKSVEYAEQLVGVEPTADNYGMLAFMTAQTGDYEAAAAAYARAAEMAQETDEELGRSDYSFYVEQQRMMESMQ